MSVDGSGGCLRKISLMLFSLALQVFFIMFAVAHIIARLVVFGVDIWTVNANLLDEGFLVRQAF